MYPSAISSGSDAAIRAAFNCPVPYGVLSKRIGSFSDASAGAYICEYKRTPSRIGIMASVALSETAGCCCALRDVAAVRQTNPAITNNKGLTFCILYFISIYLDLSIKHETSDGVHPSIFPSTINMELLTEFIRCDGAHCCSITVCARFESWMCDRSALDAERVSPDSLPEAS